MRWIGHAGLASGRPGGTPTRQTLADAARLHVDWIEIDVCRSGDGTLLLRHDLTLPSGRTVGSTAIAGVRREDPDVLTLDEAAEVLAEYDAQVLVDLKHSEDARAVAAWLGDSPDPARWAVCTDDPAALLVARDVARAVARWRTLPRVAPGPGERYRRIASCALRSLLPDRLDRLVREVGAAALSVDRWAVTPKLCAEANRLRLPVAAWTVNTPSVAHRMAACGVDFLTTDNVAELRAALDLQDKAATARCDG